MALAPQSSVLPDVMSPIGAIPLPEEEPDRQDAPSPGVWDTIKSAFRTENMIGSAISSETNGVNNAVEQGYNPWNDIVGTKYEDHWKSFTRSNNRKYTEALKRQIDREEDDRRTMAAAGTLGTVSAIAAGILDPTILIPVGGEVAAAGKAGGSVWKAGRGAAAGARAAAVGTTAQEIALQSTQETRTLEESGLAIGGSIVLGGLLGGAVGALSRPQQIAAQDALRRIQEMPLPTPGSASAAATSRLGVEDLTVAGGAAERVAGATRALSPNLRANFREAPSARQFSQELAENTLYQTMHGEGRSLGAAVETEARVAFNSRLADAVQSHDAIYAEMKKAGVNMSAQEFDEAIGRAMRRGDLGENDFVSRAAKSWRERVFEPFKNEAIDMGLLPADVSVETAESYFSRAWNVERLTAQEPEFKQKVADYYSGRLLGDYEESSRVLAERTAALDQEVADLRMTPEERARALDDLEKQGEALDAANANEIEQVSRINELRRVAKQAKDAGDVKGEQAARAEIAAIQAKGGTRLADYLKARGKLRSRQRKVDLNYAGLEKRQDRIMQSLTDLDAANRRTLLRMAEKGREMERKVADLDPDRYEAGLAKMRKDIESIEATVYRAEQRIEKASKKAPDAALTKAAIAYEAKQGPLRAQRLAELKEQLRQNEEFSRLWRENSLPVSPHEVKLELERLNAKMAEVVDEASGVTLSRGEKAQRLRERLARLDPKKLDARIAAIGEMKAKLQREFYDRWEIQRLGQGVEAFTSKTVPADTFQGELSLWHGKSTAFSHIDEKTGEAVFAPPETAKFAAFDSVDPSARYDGGGNVFGNGAVYLAQPGDTKWYDGSLTFSASQLHDVKAKFDKAFVLTPDTLEKFKKIVGVGDDPNNPWAAVAERLKAEGYDGIIVQGMDEYSGAGLLKQGRSYEEYLAHLEAQAAKHGLSGDALELLQDQVLAFKPESLKGGAFVTFGRGEKASPEWTAKLRETSRGVPTSRDVRVASEAKPNFSAQAREIADEVFDKLTGRAATAGSSVDPSYLTPITRGPMKDRTFNIPDQLVEEFLHDNVREVGERYGRTMAAEIELTRRFGRADMRDQIMTIRDEYRQLRAAADTEAKRAALAEDEKGAIRDLEAMRDLIRGTYKATENASNYGRVVRALMAFNYIRSMGGAVIANLAEIYRPAMVHGLGRYMNQGIAPLLSNIGAVKLSVKEARLAGQVTERILQHRMLSLGEIGDPYRAGTAVERWLSNGAKLGSKWNGLVYWTDGMKAISSVLSQNRILEAAVSGKKDTRLLAYLGIDGNMADRVAKQFAEHGDDLDGVKVANTEKWTDPQAVRAYRAAVSKDVDSIIVTKSVGDVPLFANTPTGKLILQFRNYTFAAHQRITLRAMQEDKAQFLSGMIGMAALGMLGATLRSWRGGESRFEKFKESASNPGYLIGEGLDLSGMFALPIEFGNTIEKLTQPTGFSFNPVKTPLLAAGTLANPDASMQGESTRFSSRDPLGAVLGPTAGLPATVARAAGAPVNVMTGGAASQSQANAAASLIPFGSYIGMREALQVVSGDSPYAAQ